MVTVFAFEQPHHGADRRILTEPPSSVGSRRGLPRLEVMPVRRVGEEGPFVAVDGRHGVPADRRWLWLRTGARADA